MSVTYDASNHWTGGSVNGSSVSFSYDGLGWVLGKGGVGVPGETGLNINAFR